MYLLGYDIGSSSIKAALYDARSGKTIKVVQHPEKEMDIISVHPGWAEQQPQSWWEAVCTATQKLIKVTGVDPAEIASIGIAYQMHGLVLVDENNEVLRPSIIWCDSRAIEIGKAATDSIGKGKCLYQYLNAPGNFTASKLKWVKDHEPGVYNRAYKLMLPGDYIAMRLTGHIQTTISGLTEGVLWDFRNHKPAEELIAHYGFDQSLLPEIVNTFSIHGRISSEAAKATGLSTNTVVSYRAGDQPNNAISLGVFNPNEVAATGGTSGVVYGVTDKYIFDDDSRINGFAHVNHSQEIPRVGILLCINGAGIQYSWVKHQISKEGVDYKDMEKMAADIPVGCDGLRIIPFGNGAERMLSNLNPGAQVNNLQFNRHSRNHFYRAALEGIAFSFVYGLELMKGLGIDTSIIKVGNDNLFQSATFSSTISNLTGCEIKVIDTTGAIGAAIASGIGAGIFSSMEEAFAQLEMVEEYTPAISNDAYVEAYNLWQRDLNNLIKQQ